jgi:hypothetical protein
MSTPHLIMWAVVAFVGFPAAVRNSTALGLVCAWLAGEITWLISGNNLPLPVYVIADCMVVGLMYGKALRAAEPWRTKVFRLYHDLTPWDRAIAGIYIFAVWPIYASDLHPYYVWWSLWWLTIAQFLLAGGDALFAHPLPKRPIPDFNTTDFRVRFAW